MRNLVVFIIGMTIGVVLSVAIVAVVKPSCPTEDSCSIDYRHGSWWINDQRVTK